MADLPSNPLMFGIDGADPSKPMLMAAGIPPNPLADSKPGELPANPLLDDSQDELSEVTNKEDEATLDHAVAYPPVSIRLCDNKGCSNPGDPDKRCGKCFISCYCSKECQVAHWKAHKKHCKLNRAFVLNSTTEEHLMCLSLDFVKHFRDNFAGSDEGYKRYKEHFDKLGTFGVEKGRGIHSVTVGVLEIVRGRDLVKLRALEKLCEGECFNDWALLLEVRQALQPVLAEKHAAGEITEEEVLDGVLALGMAYNWMKDGMCLACFHKAKQGFMRLLGPNHAKTFEASYAVASQILSREEEFAEKVRLFELAQEILPDEQVTYYLANDIGSACLHKGMYEDAQYHYVLALQGRLRVLGPDHKDTLMSLTNLGIVHKMMKDYVGAIKFYERSLEGKERTLGKTHPSTLTTMMNMATTYSEGLKMHRHAELLYCKALDGHERALGKDNEETKKCAMGLAILYYQELKDKQMTKNVVKEYPHLLNEGRLGECLREFIEDEK